MVDVFIKIAGENEYGGVQPSGRQPLSLSSFQVLARLLIIGKHGLLQRISSLVDSTRWNLEMHRAKTQISLHFKSNKISFPFSILQRKKRHFLTWEKTERSFLPQTPFPLCNPTQQVVNLFTKGLNILKYSLLGYGQKPFNFMTYIKYCVTRNDIY